MANVSKSKTIACQPGAIRSGILEEAFGQKSTGKGHNYRARLWSCLLCPDCGVDLTAGK